LKEIILKNNNNYRKRPSRENREDSKVKKEEN
jgi:hypothetical protein